MSDTDTIAVFIDAENLASACPKAGVPFDIDVLLERLREDGTIRCTRAYGDWTREPLSQYISDFHDSTVEMIMLTTNFRGKNTGDIQLAMDALEMTLVQSPPTTIVVASGDRDFVPLVQKIRRYGLKVIGVGLEGSISKALEQQCDRYVYYDDLFPDVAEAPAVSAEGEQAPATAAESAGATAAPDSTQVFELIARAGRVISDRGEIVTGGPLNVMMRQLDATYDFRRFGFEGFKEMIDAAQKAGYVQVSGQSGQDFTVEILKAPATVQPWAAAPRQRELFADKDRVLDDYRQVLADKRVPLLPAVTREALINDIWAELENCPNGLKGHSRFIWLITERARSRGIVPPIKALHKLLKTLAIAGCFKGLTASSYLDESTVFIPSVTADEACDRVDITVIRGIVMDYPHAPLVPEAVAQLLYGDSDEESLKKARRITRKIEHDALG